MNNNVECKPQAMTVLGEMIQVLETQNKESLGLMYRLDNLSNKLNSRDYPKNNNPSDAKDSDPRKEPVDFMEAIDHNLRDRRAILDGIDVAITHLERLI